MKKNLSLYGPGICPHCREFSLVYGKYELDDEYLVFPWICEVCNRQGQEVYNLVFFEHRIDHGEDGYIPVEEN